MRDQFRGIDTFELLPKDGPETPTEVGGGRGDDAPFELLLRVSHGTHLIVVTTIQRLKSLSSVKGDHTAFRRRCRRSGSRAAARSIRIAASPRPHAARSITNRAKCAVGK